VAARIGVVAFFEPQTIISPLSLFPPCISKTSILASIAQGKALFKSREILNGWEKFFSASRDFCHSNGESMGTYPACFCFGFYF
jgi:hypothetical protein